MGIVFATPDYSVKRAKNVARAVYLHDRVDSMGKKRKFYLTSVFPLILIGSNGYGEACLFSE